jgi:hypothetical protein
VGVILLMLLVGACSSGTPDIVLQATPGRPDNGQATRIEADLAAASDLEFLGTVEGAERFVTLVTFTNQIGESCVAFYSSDGHASSGCGDVDGVNDPVLVLQSSDRNVIEVVARTSPDITEVRLATKNGATSSVRPLGAFSYIEVDNDGSGYTLSLLAGDEIVYSQ